MKARVWILVALGALALLASGAPVFRDTKSPSATTVFDTILRESYGGWTGFHRCLTTSTLQHDLCWAELHKGTRYRQIEIDLDMSAANPSPREVVHHDPYTRKPIHIAAPEGHGTANTRDYGWEYLMQSLPIHRLPLTFLAVEGDPAGFPPEMFAFRCTGSAAQITCRNSLGDYLTYTPNNLG